MSTLQQTYALANDAKILELDLGTWLLDNDQTAEALWDALDAGKVRTIGVSNFLQADLENILARCRVRPMVNQVLAHVGNTPFGLVDWCQKRGILVEAYSPVAHGAVLGNKEIAAIAKRYGVTVPQLCIRYCLQLGLVALPKTGNPEHIRANAAADFEIFDSDMEALRNVSPVTDYGEASYFPVYGGKL